jgi:hypothetical protein
MAAPLRRPGGRPLARTLCELLFILVALALLGSAG